MCGVAVYSTTTNGPLSRCEILSAVLYNITMAQCKSAVPQVRLQWSYCSLALIHRSDHQKRFPMCIWAERPWRKQFHFVVCAISVDGLAPFRARASGGTVNTSTSTVYIHWSKPKMQILILRPTMTYVYPWIGQLLVQVMVWCMFVTKPLTNIDLLSILTTGLIKIWNDNI